MDPPGLTSAGIIRWLRLCRYPPRPDGLVDTRWDLEDQADLYRETPASPEAANVVLVHYADLQADLEGEMRRLAGLLGIVIGEDAWPALVAEARFDRMRDRADEVVPQATMDGLWHDTSRFFNRGTSGQWRMFLGPEDLDRYEARMRRLATPGPGGLGAWRVAGPPQARASQQLKVLRSYALFATEA
jgi:hypothetical protein